MFPRATFRSTINSIHDELSGVAAPTTEPMQPAEAQTNREESRNAVAMQNGGTFPQERSTTGSLRWQPRWSAGGKLHLFTDKFLERVS
jgi:hypothetical protein